MNIHELCFFVAIVLGVAIMAGMETEPNEHEKSIPERVLWLHVIWQALRDAHNPVGYHNERDKINLEARSWLNGCIDMAYVCHMAGVDYGLTKDAAKVKLKSNSRPHRRKGMACKGKKKGGKGK